MFESGEVLVVIFCGIIMAFAIMLAVMAWRGDVKRSRDRRKMFVEKRGLDLVSKKKTLEGAGPLPVKLKHREWRFDFYEGIDLVPGHADNCRLQCGLQGCNDDDGEIGRLIENPDMWDKDDKDDEVEVVETQDSAASLELEDSGNRGGEGDVIEIDCDTYVEPSGGGSPIDFSSSPGSGSDGGSYGGSDYGGGGCGGD